MRPILVLILCCFAGAACALDEDLNDLRGYLAFPPDYDGNRGRGRGDGEGGADGGVRIGAMYARNLTEIREVGGWFWAPEASMTIADDDVELFLLAATAHVGYAYRLPAHPNLHFEGNPFLGLGIGTWEAGRNDGTDPYWELGLRAAALYTFDNGAQAGLDLRIMRGELDELDNDGVMPCFVGGYRF